MKMQAAISVTAVLLVLFITPSSAHATPKACDLLSAQTATTLAGSPVGKPTDAEGASCTYQVTGKNASVQVILADAPGTKGSDAIESYKKASMAGAKTETIPGLGDENLLVGISRGMNQNILMVLYHQKMVALTVMGQATPELKAAMIQAVKQMIAQI